MKKIVWIMSTLLYGIGIGMDKDSNSLNEQLKKYLSQKEIEWDKVRLLMLQGALTDGETDTGDTAIILAAREGKAELISFLLERGADGNNVNDQKGTALRWACLKGDAAIARLLVAANLDLDNKDKDQSTCLMWAATISNTNTREEIVDLLLEGGADRMVGDGAGNTVYTVAQGDAGTLALLSRKKKLS